MPNEWRQGVVLRSEIRCENPGVEQQMMAAAVTFRLESDGDSLFV